MTTDTEVIVVGLGVAGASAIYALARRGIAAVGIEARRPGHQFGSSHGGSRITRTAVGEGAAYVPLVRRSDEIWAALAAEGHDLRRPTGVLYLGPAQGGASLHGAVDFMRATEAVAAGAGVALERLDAAAIRQRWPQFLVDDATQGLFELGAGVLRPEACVAALCSAAARSGAALRYDEPMLALAADGARVVVETAAGRYRAARVILAMGAWTPGFVGETFARDMQVLRQVQYWFGCDDLAAWAASPAFIWFHRARSADSFYGFPALDDGRRAVKVATEQYLRAGDPDGIERQVAPAEAAAMYETHIRGRLAGVSADCVEALACLYTHNADRARPGRFRVGPHPALAGVTVISACSGHGFKHAAGLGDAVVGSLFGEAPFCDLEAFA